jgi:uncharacterized OB-fold protein
MNEEPRPLPILDEDNREFWESCHRHAMTLQRCSACSRMRYYPAPICSSCGSLDFAWEPVSGNGVVYTYSIVRRPATPAFKDEVPYVYAIVELEEGPMMPTNIVGVPVDDVSIGIPVRLTYRDMTEDITLPVFIPKPT